MLRDPFLAGRLAMKFESTYMLDQIKEAQTRLKDKVVQNWDLVTIPVDPQNPDGSTNMNFGQIFAINAKSVNADAAKEFIPLHHRRRIREGDVQGQLGRLLRADDVFEGRREP